MVFTLDIIEEACSRTISATHQPSFELCRHDPDQMDTTAHVQSFERYFGVG